MASKPDQIEKPATLAECRACTCRAEARRPIAGRGPQSAKVALVGQNPGKDEEKQGKVFIGESGVELRKWLPLLGLREDQVWITNVNKCHTLKNRKPTAKETKTCRDLWLLDELLALPRCRAVITLGDPARYAFLGKDHESLTEATKAEIQIADRRFHIFPLAHPAYYLRNRGELGYLYKVVLPEVRQGLVEVCRE